MTTTKPLDITTRCQNCGGTRKEHQVRKPYRCPVRSKESYWQPWTVEAYEAAVEAGKAQAQEATATAHEIVLTPNYANLFAQFSRDAKWRGETLATDLVQSASENGRCTCAAEILRCVHGFLAPATIALQSATSMQAIEAIRAIMGDTLAAIDTAALAAESDQDA